MNATTIRVPENLTWKSLSERYPTTTVKVDGKSIEVNMLKDAIDDGTLLAEVEAAAKDLGVGTDALLAHLRKNWASNTTNFKKGYDCPSKFKNLRRVEMLKEFCSKARASIKNTSGKKAYWEWTSAEIMAVPLSEHRLLQSIRDNMASKKCKDLEHIPDLEQFMQHYDTACKRFSEADAIKKGNGSPEAKEAAKETARMLKEASELVDKLRDTGKLTKTERIKLAAYMDQLRPSEK